ncbi:MAG: hypothetical protein ABIO16_12180 [Nocardioides sp.]
MLRRRGVLAASLAVLLTGCSAAGEANPEKVGPRGVDELTIPTPSPNPQDFVASVDNPWLPLKPGRVWTYDVSASPATSLEMRVEDAPQTVAGVACAVVHTTATDASGRVVRESDAYFAQDLRGNVWLLGEQTPSRSWRAGEGDAEAGLFMPAEPRVGDGWAVERSPDVASDDATVLGVESETTVPAGTFADTVVIETRAGVGHLDVTRRTYAEGTGLIEALTALGGTEHAGLVSVS